MQISQSFRAQTAPACRKLPAVTEVKDITAVGDALNLLRSPQSNVIVFDLLVPRQSCPLGLPMRRLL